MRPRLWHRGWGGKPNGDSAPASPEEGVRHGMKGRENFSSVQLKAEVRPGYLLGWRCRGTLREWPPLLWSSSAPPAFQDGRMDQLVPFCWGLQWGHQ